MSVNIVKGVGNLLRGKPPGVYPGETFIPAGAALPEPEAREPDVAIMSVWRKDGTLKESR